jgi:hypothetical protein
MWYLSHVFLLPIQKISEQPCSNGEPIRHTVLWEEIRTTHKTILRVPHGSRPHGHDRRLKLSFFLTGIFFPHKKDCARMHRALVWMALGAIAALTLAAADPSVRKILVSLGILSCRQEIERGIS